MDRNNSINFDERYSRHFPLKSIGRKNQIKLTKKNAFIAGMGGLGTVSSELLASIGIGELSITDFDVVELSNLPRQKLYGKEDIGKAKVDVAEKKLMVRNPNLKINVHTTRIDALSAQLLISNSDVIIDGLDLFSTRRILHSASYRLKIPFIFAGALGESANLMTFTAKPDNPCLECVLGNIQDNRNLTCETAGVHPGILHLAGGIQATEAIKLLLDQKPSLENHMMFIDLETLDFEKIKFNKRKDCKICGTSDEGELDSGELGEITRGMRDIEGYGKALVTSICGRDTLIIDPSWNVDWDFKDVRTKLSTMLNVKVQGDNYITIIDDKLSTSILKSGVATIRGSKSSKNAINIYKKILDIIIS